MIYLIEFPEKRMLKLFYWKALNFLSINYTTINSLIFIYILYDLPQLITKLFGQHFDLHF